MRGVNCVSILRSFVGNVRSVFQVRVRRVVEEGNNCSDFFLFLSFIVIVGPNPGISYCIFSA